MQYWRAFQLNIRETLACIGFHEIPGYFFTCFYVRYFRYNAELVRVPANRGIPLKIPKKKLLESKTVYICSA